MLPDTPSEGSSDGVIERLYHSVRRIRASVMQVLTNGTPEEATESNEGRLIQLDIYNNPEGISALKNLLHEIIEWKMSLPSHFATPFHIMELQFGIQHLLNQGQFYSDNEIALNILSEALETPEKTPHWNIAERMPAENDNAGFNNGNVQA